MSKKKGGLTPKLSLFCQRGAQLLLFLPSAKVGNETLLLTSVETRGEGKVSKAAGWAHILKSGDAGDKPPPIFLDYPPNFRLSTWNP